MFTSNYAGETVMDAAVAAYKDKAADDGLRCLKHVEMFAKCKVGADFVDNYVKAEEMHLFTLSPGHICVLAAVSKDRRVVIIGQEEDADTWSLSLSAMARNMADAISLAEELQERIPAKPEDNEVTDPANVSTTFWSLDNGHVSEYEKEIACPAWTDIEGNYPSRVAKELSRMFSIEEDDFPGKIILWHGIAGSGKTYCIRALLRDWADRLDATCEVVLDPEAFFSNTAYIRNLLLSSRRQISPALVMQAVSGTRRRRRRRASAGRMDALRLIVIEDAADVFSIEAARKSIGFSRLLNLTDGILGQGLRIVFLFTANETIEKIDPAIIRSGRCLQQVNFTPFGANEARDWLQTHGANVNGHVPAVLSDMYASLRGETVTTRERIGF